MVGVVGELGVEGVLGLVGVLGVLGVLPGCGVVCGAVPADPGGAPNVNVVALNCAETSPRFALNVCSRTLVVGAMLILSITTALCMRSRR